MEKIVARSLAFWVDKDVLEESSDTTNQDHVGLCVDYWSIGDTRKITQVELHFNYWSLDSSTIDYLDIGVKISCKGVGDFINFYLPFDKESITYKSGLGEKICGDEELLSAIFNNSVSKIEILTHDVYAITFAKNDERLLFHTQILKEEDDSSDGVKIVSSNHDDEKGIILRFPASLVCKSSEESCYFRFRVVLKENDKKSISNSYEPKDWWLTFFFDKTEMVDFRVNEPRNLPKKIRSKLNSSIKISAIHFFLIREAFSEFKMSHADFYRCRILEKNLWDKYLSEPNDNIKNKNPWYWKILSYPWRVLTCWWLCLTNSGGCRCKSKIPNQMLIYHWRNFADNRQGTIERFSAFAKFTQRRSTFGRIMLAVGTVVFLGFCGSSLSTEFYPSIQKIYPLVQKFMGVNNEKDNPQCPSKT